MKNFQNLKKFRISDLQMKKITGGDMPGVYLDCVNANGGTTSVYVPYPANDKQIAASIDSINDSGAISPIVGCEAPY